jgi:hypothetical protein
VLFENAGYGSEVAAPVAEEVILAYLRSTGDIKPKPKEDKPKKDKKTNDTLDLMTAIEENR